MIALAGVLSKVLFAVLATTIARLMLGAGLAFVTYQALDGYVEGFLTQMTTSMSGLPADMLLLLTMAGVPAAMEIIGSAMLTVVSIKLTDRIMGVRLTD